jgi:hypothetical protein
MTIRGTSHGGDLAAIPGPGLAWLSLCLAVALHVADEAMNGFLAVYNPTVLRIREALPFLPLPTFTFQAWITGLAAALLLGLALTPLVFRRSRPMRVVMTAVAALMVLNALGHVTGSVFTGTLLPGTYSAPILLAAAVWAVAATRTSWTTAHPG